MIWLARLTAPEAAGLARDPKAVVFLPLGAIEQHGPHLPLLVDWRSAEEPARRISVPTLRRLIVEVVAGPGGAGYFGWSAAARTKTGREAMALRDRLICRTRPGARKPAPFLTTSARRVRVKRIQIDEMGRNTFVHSLTRGHTGFRAGSASNAARGEQL